MSVEEMAKVIHDAGSEEALLLGLVNECELVSYEGLDEKWRDLALAIARAALSYLGFEGEPEEGCVRKARERLQALSVHSTHTQMMKCVEEALRALSGKETRDDE